AGDEEDDPGRARGVQPERRRRRHLGRPARPPPAVHPARRSARPVLDARPAAVPVLLVDAARRRHPRHVRLARGTLSTAATRRAPRRNAESFMSNLQDLADLPLLEIWGEGVRARRIQGERITLAIVELAPNAVVPEHRHAAE